MADPVCFLFSFLFCGCLFLFVCFLGVCLFVFWVFFFVLGGVFFVVVLVFLFFLNMHVIGCTTEYGYIEKTVINFMELLIRNQ